MNSEQKMNFETYKVLVDSVLVDIRPYLKSEGEMMLGSLLAQAMVKNQLVTDEHQELKKAHQDLRQGYDEIKNLIFELSKKQKDLNGYYSKKFNNIQKKLS